MGGVTLVTFDTPFSIIGVIFISTLLGYILIQVVLSLHGRLKGRVNRTSLYIVRSEMVDHTYKIIQAMKQNEDTYWVPSGPVPRLSVERPSMARTDISVGIPEITSNSSTQRDAYSKSKCLYAFPNTPRVSRIDPIFEPRTPKTPKMGFPSFKTPDSDDLSAMADVPHLVTKCDSLCGRLRSIARLQTACILTDVERQTIIDRCTVRLRVMVCLPFRFQWYAKQCCIPLIGLCGGPNHRDG
jgi:hypothetical protein